MDTTFTISTVEELLEICNRRLNFYRELKSQISDDLCKAIISRLINQSEIFLGEIVEEGPPSIILSLGIYLKF